MPNPMRAENFPDEKLLELLEPRATELYADHIVLSDKHRWYPHKEVPWSFAENFEPDYIWTPEDAPISPELGATLLVNLLTEDNLPYYFQELAALFGENSVWDLWNKRWTAEEGRHSIVIRDGLSATRLVDPVLLEDNRMHQVSTGLTPHFDTTLDGIMYVVLQELATRVSHQRTANRMIAETSMLTDTRVVQAIGKVAGGIRKVMGDESRHHQYYLGLAKEAFRIAPDLAMASFLRVLKDFAMPGTGIEDFETRKSQIADIGVYDGAVHIARIVMPTIKDLRIETNTDVGQEGTTARKDIMRFVKFLGSLAERDARMRMDVRSGLLVPADLS